MSAARILLVDDEQGILDAVGYTLRQEGFEVVTATDGENKVQVIDDNKVVTREVEIGLRSASRAEVTSGLTENELVVARAGSFLRDGDTVTPVEANVAEASR